MGEKENINVADKSPVTTEQMVDQVLRFNLMSLAKKVKDGKVLNASEIAMLQSAKSGASNDGWAKNQVHLANELGVERKTIQRWLKEEGNPGARSNGQFNVAEWRTWAISKGKKIDIADDLPSQQELRSKNLLLINQKLEHNLAVMRGEYVSISEVEQLGSELAAQIRKVVSALHLLAPSLVRCSTVEQCEKILLDKEDEVIEQLYVMAQGIKIMSTPKAAELDEAEVNSALDIQPEEK